MSAYRRCAGCTLSGSFTSSTPSQSHYRKTKERIQSRIWWLYDDPRSSRGQALKAYYRDPTLRRKVELKRRFDRLFTTETGYVPLDRFLARLRARRHELLAVLVRSDIPLHTNGPGQIARQPGLGLGQPDRFHQRPGDLGESHAASGRDAVNGLGDEAPGGLGEPRGKRPRKDLRAMSETG